MWARLASVAATAMAAIVLAACAGRSVPADSIIHQPADALSAAPADLTIDATILTGRRVHASIRRAMASREVESPLFAGQRQAGRLVLMPGGTLHAGREVAPGPAALMTGSRGAGWFPPPVRVLDREQIAAVWARARQLGLGDPANADFHGNPTLVDAGPDDVVHLIELQAAGRRWAFVRRSTLDGETDGATTALIRQLSELAWLGDGAPTSAPPPGAPRHDFGPDPYARYRP